MNSNSQQPSRAQSGITAGSPLTASWLLWGLPERLGLAAAREGRVESHDRRATAPWSRLVSRHA